MTFAEAAARLAALAAKVLGWRPHEFWAATPAELALSLGADEQAATPLSRTEVQKLIEREPDHARSR